MKLFLLIFGPPIPLFLVCAWLQWFLVSHIKDRVIRVLASSALPILTGGLTALCVYQMYSITGWDSLTWGLLYFPMAVGALGGTLLGWLLGWAKRRKGP